MPAKHKLYGGSNAEIWWHCAGWASLVRQMPKKPAGMAAHVGTAQHVVMERLLADPDLTPASFLGVSILTEGGNITIDKGHVAAIEIALGAFETVLAEHEARGDGDLQLFSERFVQGAEDDQGGTVDALVVKAPRATFVDFKFGQLEIEAEKQQNFWYMICAKASMPSLFRGVDEWESVIIQPVYDPAIDRVVITTTKLDQLALEASLAIARSKEPNPPFVEGVWCEWCDAKLACPAKTQRLQTLVAPNHALDLAETEKLLAQMRTWDKWRAEAEERIHLELQYGWKGEHFKLVNKRGERRWINEPAAIELLKSKGRTPSEYLTTPELHSPAQMEARGLLRKGEITQELAQVYSSGTTIAPISDKRPAVLPSGALAQALKR